MKTRLAVFLVAAGLVNVTALATQKVWASDEGDFGVAAGFDYSTGKYGSALTTEMLSIPIVGTYRTQAWMFGLTVPYVSIVGPGDVVVGGRRARAPASPVIGAASTTRSGMGDVLAAATFRAYSTADQEFGLDLSGRIKFATAGTGLGTGENDYAAQVDAYRRVDRGVLLCALGVDILGSPAGMDVNSVAYGILGGAYQLTDRTRLGAEMKLAQKASVIDAEQRELFVYAGHRLNERFSIRGHVSKGFADGSPDSGFGVLVSSEL